MIAIIDYKAGNLASVINALRRLEADFVVTNEASVLDKASKVIFPGVGHAWSAMEALREFDLDIWLRTTRKPVLGICLGMQLLYESSDEGGGTEGLGLIPGHLKRFDEAAGKVPHMGWNDIKMPDPVQVYFVHSYYAPVNEFTVSECDYNGQVFSAAVQRGNFSGVQFHPEKSGEAGLEILKQFVFE